MRFSLIHPLIHQDFRRLLTFFAVAALFATSAITQAAQLTCQMAFEQTQWSGPLFPAQGGSKIQAFREALVENIRHVPFDEVERFLFGMSESIGSLNLGKASLLTRIANEAENALEGEQSYDLAMADIIEAIMSASETDLMVLEGSISDRYMAPALYDAFTKSDFRIQTVIMTAITGARTFTKQLRELFKGTSRTVLAHELRHQFIERRHGRSDHNNAFGPEFFLGPSRSPTSSSHSSAAYFRVPSLFERLGKKVYIDTGLAARESGFPKGEFYNVISGDAGWNRMDSLTRLLESEKGKHVSVDLKVQNGASFYTELQKRLAGRVVTGASMNPNSNKSKPESGFEFRGVFVSARSAYARNPLFLAEPAQGRLQMEITIKVKGRDVVIPIYKDAAILFVETQE